MARRTRVNCELCNSFLHTSKQHKEIKEIEGKSWSWGMFSFLIAIFSFGLAYTTGAVLAWIIFIFAIAGFIFGD